MNHRYHIGTGYHPKPDGSSRAFYALWGENTYRYSKPTKVTVLADSGAKVPWGATTALRPTCIELSGDLGHFMNLVNNEKPHAYNGWSGAMLALAMIAYCDEADFIFKESDCFAFGPWVEKLYEEIGDAGAIWGRCSFMPCEQSLFLVKHAAIPDFVRHFLDGPPQRTHDQLGEHRFVQMEQKYPERYKRFSFGVGRDRPIPWDAPVFYFQQPKPAEIEEAIARGIL